MQIQTFMLRSYRSLMIGGILAFAIIVPVTMVAVHEDRTNFQRYASLQRALTLRPEVSDCISVYDDATLAVGGLQRDDVPRMPASLRLSYDGIQESHYVYRGHERDVFNYYLSKLASQCWELTAVKPHEAVWKKDGEFLKLAVLSNPLGGKNVVNYRVGGTRVLGVTYIATEGSCAPDQMYCPGSGCYPSGTACPSSTQCSGAYQQSGMTASACNLTTCPNGCTYGPDGCPNGCYSTPPTNPCPSSFSNNGTYACSYTMCPSGCTFGPDGCPNGCQSSTPSTSCSGSYQQPGATYPSCNYTACPNGCTWNGPGGCPDSCMPTGPGSCTGGQIWCTSSSGSGGWCQMSPCPATGPSSCTGSQVWCSSASGSGWCQMPPCPSSTPPSCPSNQYWCYSSNSCLASGSYCAPSGTSSGNDQASCTAGGGLWCQPTTSPHCHYGPNPPPCESDTTGSGSCAGGQVWCPSSSGGSGWCQMPPCPSTSPGACTGGQIWCTGASGSGGWCQMPPCPTTCSTGQYWCSVTNSCISNSAPCSTNTTCSSATVWCQGSQACLPMGSYCPPAPAGNDQASCTASGGLWCQPNSSPHCHPGPNPASCEPDTTGPYTYPAVSCQSGYYSCNGACIPSGSTCMPSNTTTPSCPSNQFWCYSSSACLANGSYCSPTGSMLPSNDRTSCVGSGGLWCQPNSSPHCHNGPNPVPCEPESPTTIPVTCSAGQYVCNNACVPTGTSCNGYPYYTPGTTPQQPAYLKECPAGMYWCGSTSSCKKSGESCDMKEGDVRLQGPGDAEKQRVDERRLRDMKRELQQFSRGIKDVEKMVKQLEAKLKRQNIGIPAELKAALAKAPQIITAIKNAKTPDEIEDLMESIQDVSDTVQQWAPRLGDLTRLADMLKRANTDMKKLQRSVQSSQQYAKKNVALTNLVDELTALSTAMNQALQSAKELAKTEPDSALDMLDEEFYSRMEEFWSLLGEIDMVRNLSQGITQAKREIRQAEQRVTQLERRKGSDKEFIQSLKDLVTQMKDVLADIQKIAAAKPIDTEALKITAEDLWDVIESFKNQLDEIGSGIYRPQIQAGKGVQFILPDSFDFGSRAPMQAPETAIPVSPLQP